MRGDQQYRMFGGLWLDIWRMARQYRRAAADRMSAGLWNHRNVDTKGRLANAPDARRRPALTD
jgi:hypothetical protein